MAIVDTIMEKSACMNTFNVKSCFGMQSIESGYKTFSVFSYETMIGFGVAVEKEGIEEHYWFVNTAKYSSTTSKHRNSMLGYVKPSNVLGKYSSEEELLKAKNNFLPQIFDMTIPKNGVSGKAVKI